MAHITHSQVFSVPGASGEPGRQETPLAICLVGDFSAGDGDFRLHELDAELDIDDVLAMLAPEVPSESSSLAFRCLDDFQPENLFEQSPALRQLDGIAASLRNPSTATAALAELGASSPPPQPVGEAPQPPPDNVAPGNDNPLARLLGGAPKPPPPARVAASTLDVILREAVEGNVIADVPTAVRVAGQYVDELRAQALKSLLREPGFADLERTWRSADLLFDGIETMDLPVRFWLLDVPRDALHDDLRASQSGASRLVQSLAEFAAGIPAAHALGQLVFLDPLDLSEPTVAQSLCRCISALQTTGFVGSDTALFAPTDNPMAPADGGEVKVALGDLVELASWTKGMPGAKALSVTPFRALLRVPYGPESDPVPGLDFHEVRCAEDVVHLPWASGAVAAALAFANEWVRLNHPPALPCAVDLADLPFATAPLPDRAQLIPNGGYWLGNEPASHVVAAGFSALLSRRDQPGLRVLVIALGSAG